MLERILKLTAIVLLVTLSVCAAIVTPTLNRTLVKIEETAGEGKRAATAVADWAQFQTAEFQSERYQKSIKAGIDTGAYANSVMRSINLRLIPEFVALLKGLQGNSADARALTAALADMVRHTDVSLNSSTGLLPSMTTLVGSFNTLAEKTGLTIEEVNQAVKQASEKIGLSLDAMYKLMADPAWLKTLENIQTATAGAAETSGNVAKASKELPSIAASLEKIAKTSSRFSKITLVANLVAILASAFLPFLR